MAATPLWFAGVGPITRALTPDFLDKAMDVFLLRQDRLPPDLMRFFTSQTSSTNTFKITDVGKVLDLPPKSEDTDPMPRANPTPGYDQSVTIYQYRQSISVTQRLLEIDQSGLVRAMMAGLLDCGKRKVAYMLADVLNSATTTAGADGSNLIATDHYFTDPAHGQWSNQETGAALTSASANLMRVSMRKRYNEKGMPMDVGLKLLFGAVDHEQKLRQIAGSDKTPEYATNAINDWKGIDWMVSPYLTSTTRWWGWGDLDESMWGLHYVIEKGGEPSVAPLTGGDITTDIKWGRRLRMKVAVGYTVLRNLHSNAGA